MFLHKGLLCILPWLIPLTALAKPPALPQASVPVQVQVPVSGQFMGADGTHYTLSGTLLLSVDTPVPPPPTDLKIAYLSMVPAAVTAGQRATVNVVMTRAAQQDTAVALTSADANVQVSALLTIPAGQDHAGATVLTLRGVTAEKLAAITAKYGASSGSANLRVLPDGLGPPPPPPGAGTPLVSAYLNTDGSPVLNPKYGQEIRITGSGFGTTMGKVYWQGGEVSMLAWSDTLIRVQLPTPVFTGATQFSLWRPDGVWSEWMVPTDLPQRLPGSAKRR